MLPHLVFGLQFEALDELGGIAPGEQPSMLKQLRTGKLIGIENAPGQATRGASVSPETAEACYFSKIIFRVVVKAWLLIR